MYKLFAILIAIIVMYFLSLILLRDSSAKKKKGSISNLIDDEVFRESIRKETNTFFSKSVEPMMKNNNELFSFLFKIFLIDMDKLETLLLRAGEERRTKEEVAVTQLTWALAGFGGFFFFLYMGQSIMMSILVLMIGIVMYVQEIVKLKGRHSDYQLAFKKDFPNFLESYRIPVENGMQADNAFRRVSDDWEGIVGEEFRKACIDARNYQGQLFIPLQKLAFKLNYPSFYNFVSTFSTTIRSGSDMAPFIGSICNDIRITTHNEILEKNRQKDGPIVILIVFFIFLPTLFLMVGPTFLKAFL